MKHTAILFFLLLCSLHVQAEWSTLVGSISQFSQLLPQEKVYLHFDNTGYFRDEQIWFKAYILRADTEQSTNISGVLYVDLVSPRGDIVLSEKLKIENGQADGSISLRNIYSSGFYEVRAYTRYMLNWGQETVFSRVFPIFDKTKKGDYSSPHIETQQAPRVKQLITIYPEGGHLVEGMTNSIAFKVTDKNGRPVNAKGKLISGNGTEYDIKTAHDGMGRFSYIPHQGEKARISLSDTDGNKYETSMNEPESQGVALTLSNINPRRITAQIQATSQWHGDSLLFLITHRGTPLIAQTSNITAEPLTLTLPTEKLGEGVNRLSVITRSGDILADRLFFVYPADTANMVKVSSSTSLHPYGRINMTLNTDPNTSLSVAVRDDAATLNGQQGDVHSWLLLSSELKGFIHHPEYYVERNDREHRIATDLLMMVQGWRRYDLNEMMGKKQFVIKQPIETQLSIRGRLKSSYSSNAQKAYRTEGSKGVANVDMHFTLHNNNGESLKGDTKTDSEGYYTVMVPDCTGEWTMFINTSKYDTQRKLLVGIDRHFHPEARQIERIEMLPVNSYKGMANYSLPYISSTASETEKATTTKGDMTQRIHKLQGITVRKHFWDSNIPWDSQNLARKSSSIYYNIDKESDAFADRGETSPYLIEWLEKKVPELRGDSYEELYNEPETISDDSALTSKADFGYNGMPTVWIVDNAIYKITNLHGRNIQITPYGSRSVVPIPHLMENVKAVYISTDPEVSKQYLLQTELPDIATVFIYTHRTSQEKVKGLRRTHFEGYAEPQTFQHLDYSLLPKEEDYRRTLYWNPNLKTDATGKAEISFYNNMHCTSVTVSAEGITPAGKAVTSR